MFMMQPHLMSDEGKARLLEMIQEAERERRVRRILAGQDSAPKRFLTGLGDILITAGQKLKTQNQPVPLQAK